MKKIYLLLAAGVTLFASCAKENGGNSALTGKEMYVSFQVKAPTSGVVTYAEVPNAVPEESKIFDLCVYVFGRNVNATPEEVGTTDEYVLEDIYELKDLPNDGSNYTVSGLKVTGETMKHFYFMANRISRFSIGMKETQIVNATLISASAASNTQPYISLLGWSLDAAGELVPDQSGAGRKNVVTRGLPMSAYCEIDFSSGQPAITPAIDITPLRSVARVDVYNRTANYTVKSITVRSRNNGYRFPGKFKADGSYDSYLYAGMNTLGYSGGGENPRVTSHGYEGVLTTYGKTAEPNGGLESEEVLPATTPKTYLSKWLGAGYLYECPAGENEGASVFVELYNEATGVTKALEYPFHDGTAYLAVKRNHVYRLVVRETVSQDIELGFTVLDWTDAEKLEVNINASPKVTFSSVAGDLPSGATLSTNTTSTLNTTLTALKTGGVYKVTIQANGLPVAYFNESEITDAPFISPYSLTCVDADENIYEFTFTLAENTWRFNRQVYIGFKVVTGTGSSPVSYLYINQPFV